MTRSLSSSSERAPGYMSHPEFDVGYAAGVESTRAHRDRYRNALEQIAAWKGSDYYGDKCARIAQEALDDEGRICQCDGPHRPDCTAKVQA